MRNFSHILILLAIVALAATMAGCAGPQGTGPTPAPTATPTSSSLTDLTNQNSPEAATFTTYPSLTKLHTPDVAGRPQIHCRRVYRTHHYRGPA